MQPEEQLRREERGSEPEALGYASPKVQVDWPQQWNAPVASFFLAIVGAVFFPCMCGHLGVEGLIVTLPAIALASYGWVSNKNRSVA